MSTSDRPQQTYGDDSIDILLVEDNPGDARLTREAFRETEAETAVHVVTNGDEAISHLSQRTADHAASLPDLVLLDLNLPGTDGHEVLKAIRDSSDLRSLPILILTSSEDSDDVMRCYEAAANAYLTKPTSPDRYVSVAESIERFWFSSAKLPPV